ncbi:SWIM zinc finger family protein [Streptomyces sp. NBC_01601]|uniref:SWIM zinc finger family protein n=1 Tax=Streptomyces sp. NBC_01601 TaxID=2975892 RepID=UPI002E2E894B|nr:SWIM zinc finger family protein [Streptomyces sp. NBC_01601]
MSTEATNPADKAREALRAARAGASGGERGEEGTASSGMAATPDVAHGDREAELDEGGAAPAEAQEAKHRPGEAARAALRGAPEAGGVASQDAAGAEARPGEVARAALRAAVAARREGAEADFGSDAESDDLPAPADPPPTTEEPTPTSPRPADVAREALRAARREAERRPRRTTPRPVPAPAEGSGRSARAQVARDMRDFLSNAFRMPERADEPDDDDTQPPADTPEPVGMASLLKAAPAIPRDRDHTPPRGAPTTSEPGPAAGHPTPEPPTEHAPTPASPEPTEHERTPSRTSTAAHPHPAPPHIPSSMATPHRDNELRRTFPPFAPRPEAHQEFAGTWWGQSWVDALERGALDVDRLSRGRGYADAGNVDAITVTPGLVLAYVRGSRPRPYRVQMRLRTLDDTDWDRFLDAAAGSPGHIAALLDKELPHTLADCGVPLLPGPGDLTSHCSCPDSGRPCKHAAALCYQTARLLDADPFVLLLLRGRGERELLDALARRSAADAARAARERGPAALPGVRASEALAGRPLPPLPAPLPAPAHPEAPPAYPAAPGGPDPFALDQLATDAAARAHALLTTGRDPVGGLTLWQDAVRLAAARPGSGLTATTRSLYATLAAAVRRTPAELARAVAAWRQGGFAGLRVLEEPWDPPAGRFDRARPLLLAADLPAFRPWRNHLTHPAGHAQLRLGQDGLWYAYESEPGQEDWWPRGAPDLDPVSALTTLDIPDSL